MRELTQMELEMVEGGNPAAAAIVVAGIVILAGIAVVAYAVYNECDATLEVSSEGITLEISCDGDPNG